MLNYTGQRLDGTGLLFYNARYYDPAIGRFLSADTVAPHRENSQSRNRYSYVLNNPLKYTDPTGHCGQSTDTADETKACTQAVDDLNAYDIHIGDLDGGIWSSDELSLVLDAVVDMLNALFGGAIDNFRAKIGTVTMYQSAKNSEGAWFSGSKEASAITGPGGWGSSNITFYQSSFADGTDYFKRTVVHELGHAWDIHSIGIAGVNLAFATKSRSTGHGYNAGGKTTFYGRSSSQEDWAESVAETVYDPPSSGGIKIDETREKAVRSLAKLEPWRKCS